MVQHQAKNEDKSRASGKRRQSISPEAASAQEPVMESGGIEDIISGLPAESQAALLMNAGSDEHRANLALRLQRSHGNAYVQALLSSRTVQAKLTISQPEDASESEADEVADSVIQKVSHPVQRQEEELLQGRFSHIQRQGVPEEEEIQALRSENLEERINAAREGGQPLSPDTRATLEPHFGHDFGQVHVHTDAKADNLNRQLDAEAFTTGSDIFFKQGNYKPESSDGQWLLAHELTHVIQQGAASRSPDTGVTRLQMLRSGRVGNVQYDESPVDVIRISMSYQIDSFDTILGNINQVIQGGFGSSGRTYTGDEGFQADLRAYLESIDHPSFTGGGPVMTRQRHLSFTIRLVRSGQRIETIEFVTPISEVVVETPETIKTGAPASAGSAGTAAPGPAPAEPMSGEWEEILSEAEPPETAGTTELPPGPPGTGEIAGATGPEAAEGGIAQTITGGLESIADLTSGRWVWNPVTNQMAEWEAELDEIGDQFQTQPLLGQVLLPTVTHLFVILQTITGTLDLLARLSPPSLVARLGAAGTGLISGLTSPEELAQDMEEIGDEALDIVTLGLRGAAAHLREGVQELNVFRIVQGIDEVILAILSLVGIFRGIRAARARLQARRGAGGSAEAAATTESGAVETGEGARRGTGPAEAPPAEQASTAVETGATESGGRATMLPPEPRPGLRPASPSEGLRPTEVGEGLRPTEPGGNTRSTGTGEAVRPTEPGETVRPTEETVRASRGEGPIESIEEARRVVEEYRREGINFFNAGERMMEWIWRRSGRSGPTPAAYIDARGRLYFDESRLGSRASDAPGPRAAEAGPRAETGEAYRPTEPGEAPRSGESTRPQSAGEPPAGNLNGLSIEYIIEEVADVRQLRDQIMRGERSGRCSHGSAEFVQGEWEAFGGEGPAPPAWWQNDGVLRINRERVGWASPEVQAAYAERIAGQAEARAGAMPEIQLGVQVVLEEVEVVRQMMQDPSQIQLGIDRKPNAQAMQRVWERLGEEGEAPVGFIDTEGVLVVNMEAVQAAVPES